MAPEMVSSAVTKKRIGTHNGSFHCDEALGCFLMRLTDKFRDAEVVRTRNQQILDTLDAVLDVGAVYDPERDRYDHHQGGFHENFGHGFTTKLSSAGLVYKHFGREIVGKELKSLTPEEQELVYVTVYKHFMEAIDANDNGISQYDTQLQPRYIESTSLPARVSRLNPDWTEENTEARENEGFARAMQLTGQEFLESLRSIGEVWLPARSIVSGCLERRFDSHKSGEILVLDRFCPWKLHLFDLEQELKIDPSIKYCLYQDDRSGSWRVQAVSVAPGNFESRKPLPEAWRSMRDEELSQVADIPGCIFVHTSGFIGGNKTIDGALAMASKALTMS
eukprot:TRINITY_DN6041_c0_g2_i1.p1 TRINITY_DN6041_c0_g2~~TRINITY_DN6041_c0_g2_i1.p1  ORF type:complete len:335 (-),score=52.87 TRINITY_DN6041_c0_g2_i1:184-1188(-)